MKAKDFTLMKRKRVNLNKKHGNEHFRLKVRDQYGKQQERHGA